MLAFYHGVLLAPRSKARAKKLNFKTNFLITPKTSSNVLTGTLKKSNSIWYYSLIIERKVKMDEEVLRVLWEDEQVGE